MPLLAALITNVFTALVTWLGQYFTKKVAFGAAVVAAYSTLTAALLVGMRLVQTAMNSYVDGVPANAMALLGQMVPSATPFCMTALLTTWVATTVYAWQRESLRLVAQV